MRTKWDQMKENRRQQVKQALGKTKSQLQQPQQLKNYFVFSNENLTKPSASSWALPLKHSPHYSPPRNNSLSLFPHQLFHQRQLSFFLFFFCFLSPKLPIRFYRNRGKRSGSVFLKVFSLKSVPLKQE